MTSHFQDFLRSVVPPQWHPRLWSISSRADDPEPDRSTPKCRVVDHTQAFRLRFAKQPPQTTANHRQPSQTSHTS